MLGDRREVLLATVVAEPAAAPVPPTSIAAIQKQDVAEAIRTAKNITHEVYEIDAHMLEKHLEDAIVLVLAALVVLPESGKDSGAIDNALQLLKTNDLHFSCDWTLALGQAVEKLGLGKVNISKDQGRTVAFFLSLKAIATLGALPECPAVANKLGGIERGGGDLKASKYEPCAIPEKRREPARKLLWRETYHLRLELIPVDLVPVNLGPNSTQNFYDLTARYVLTHGTPTFLFADFDLLATCKETISVLVAVCHTRKLPNYRQLSGMANASIFNFKEP